MSSFVNPSAHPYYSPAPAQLRRLIFSYLAHNCHINTARSFVHDSQRIALGDDYSFHGLNSDFGHRTGNRDIVTGETLPEPDSYLPSASRNGPIQGLIPVFSSGDLLIPSPLELRADDDMAFSAPDELNLPTSTPQSLKESDGDHLMGSSENTGSPPVKPFRVEHLQSDGTALFPTTDDIEVDAVVLAADQFGPGTKKMVHDAIGNDEWPSLENAFTSDGMIQEDTLQQTTLRKDIRDHILWGRISEATELLNTHFPSVLQENQHPPSPSPEFSAGTHDIPTIKAPLHPAQTLLRPSSNQNSPFVFPQSLAPAHLMLNLRIQAFIEAVRTRPLVPTPSPSVQHNFHHQLAYDPFLASSPPSPRPSHDQAVILRLGRDLAHIAQSLPNPTDRAVYLKELDNIWALMAYPEPEGKSPPQVSKYLWFDRREALADQINGAILLRTGHNPSSALESYIRATGALWNYLHEIDARIPSDPSSYPAGSGPPPSRPPTLKFPSPNNRDNVVAPPFDFMRFLSSQ